MGLTRKQWFMLVVIVTGSFITLLNQTIVTPALPSMMVDLQVDATLIQWLTTGFTLVNAIMIPITAYLQDRFSVRALFLVSMGLFSAGTLLCGWGPDFGVLLGGRLVQAAGAGIIMPMVMTVLMITFPIERRGTALGIFGLVNAFAPAFGPTVSGIMIDAAGWHLMFFIIAGLSIAIMIAGIAVLSRTKPEGSSNVVLDKPSLILSTVGFGGLLYGFSVIGSVGFQPLDMAIAAVGLVCLIFFFRRQLTIEHPMLRVDVLENRKFLVATIIGMLCQAALLVTGILMPIYIQTLCGYPATVSGLVLMPGAIVMGAMNPIAGKLFDKHGPRALGLVGMVLMTITTFGFSILTTTTSIIYVTCLYVVRMFAMTLVNMPITTWGMNALDNKVINHGTSVNNTLRMVAGSLGTALIVSLSTAVTNAATPGMGTIEATMLGNNVAFFACTVLCVIGLVVTILTVKQVPGESAVRDADDTHKNLLTSIMKTDVYTLHEEATVEDAIKMFIEKKISAAPVVNDEGEAVGFLSDGDILRRLSRQANTFIDPIVMILRTVNDEQDYNDKLDDLMSKKVRDIGVGRTIGVDIHDDLAEVCRVLSENHLKKVPVLEDGKIVGVINRSDITQHTMSEYLKRRTAVSVS